MKGSIPAPKPAPRISLTAVLDQLNHEYANVRQEDPSDLDVTLRAYVHVSATIGAHWVNGDPFTWDAPPSYRGERLWKLCMWLRGIPEDGLKVARHAQVVQLTGAAWTNYAAQDVLNIPDGLSALDLEAPCLPFTWESIDTLWQTDEYLSETPNASYLPKFNTPASETWHLVALAVVYLNRACRYNLLDLTLYQTGDGK